MAFLTSFIYTHTFNTCEQRFIIFTIYKMPHCLSWPPPLFDKNISSKNKGPWPACKSYVCLGRLIAWSHAAANDMLPRKGIIFMIVEPLSTRIAKSLIRIVDIQCYNSILLSFIMLVPCGPITCSDLSLNHP